MRRSPVIPFSKVEQFRAGLRKTALPGEIAELTGEIAVMVGTRRLDSRGQFKHWRDPTQPDNQNAFSSNTFNPRQYKIVNGSQT
jgi:hypothetical protein